MTIGELRGEATPSSKQRKWADLWTRRRKTSIIRLLRHMTRARSGCDILPVREIMRMGLAMSIILTPEQQKTIEQAIESGLVRSVDEFIDSALGALSHRNGEFDKAQAQLAGERIRELRKGVRLDLKGMSIRQLAHTGHKY
jgi:Arc/MetJ-type ribon-helix-helix transcriptional regulator